MPLCDWRKDRVNVVKIKSSVLLESTSTSWRGLGFKSGCVGWSRLWHLSTLQADKSGTVKQILAEDTKPVAAGTVSRFLLTFRTLYPRMCLV
jgi:hypothetical protein